MAEGRRTEGAQPGAGAGAGAAPGTDGARTAPTGVGVVVTRDEPDDGPLSALLADRGFRVLNWPTIRTAPPEDPAPLEAALAELDDYDWGVFTSPRAAAAVAGLEPPPALSVAAVGEATADALADIGWVVDLVPDTQTGDALVIALAEAGVGEGARVLFPASAIARDTVPDGLERLGADVTQVVAYRTEPAPLDVASCRTALESGAVEVLTFTSPSTVQNLQAALGPQLFALAARRARAVAIGPTTAEAVRATGFDDVIVAEPHSLEGLAARVAEVAGRDPIEEAT